MNSLFFKLRDVIYLAERFGIACLFFATTLALAQQQSELPALVREQLSLAQIPDSAVGIIVQPLDAAGPIVSFNASEPMNPASTMKLLTTFAVIDVLGPAFTWRTQFYSDGPLENEILDGNLIVKGYGDPSLTLERLWLMLRELRQRGLREIHGDLILDRSYFQVPDLDPSRFDNKPSRPYNAVPDALLLNNQAMRLKFIPNLAQNSVKILADPHPAQVEVSESLTLDTEDICGDWEEKMGNDIFYFDTSVSVTFSGSYPASCGDKTRYISVLTPAHYFYGVFMQMWQELGGTLSGQTRDQVLPPEASLLAEFESRPLAEVVRDTNKFSNNVMARQLFLTIGALTQGEPATIQKSEIAIAAWLQKKNLSFPELVLENGSGLSRMERISASHMAELLVAAHRSPFMPELLASLPLLGIDGTVKDRLVGSDVTGRAHIKTGSLEGVRAIAGYVLDHQGRTIVVVCIINHENTSAAKAIQDALIQWVYQRQ